MRAKKMNKKGNVFYRLMMVVVIYFAVVALGSSVNENAEISRNADNLDCDNTTISDGTKLTCVGSSLFPFVYHMLGLGAASSYLVWSKPK
jgi:hypothetical protein